MSLPRDYEKELATLLLAFRAKCTELNLVNSEVAAVEKRRAELYDAYTEFAHKEVMPRSAQLVEIRSELQAMQATMLDILVEFMTREGRHE